MQRIFPLIEIPDQQRSFIKNSFGVYANTFRKADRPEYNEHMKLKQVHTARVVQEIRDLGKSLHMSESEIAFIEIIAWLHDIGRFEQFDKYGTFSDAESENHAEIGLRVAEDQKLLHIFSPFQQELICKSIRNHNIPQVPGGESPEADFYSRVLRDADKLDIWRVTIGTNIFHRIKTEKMPESYLVPPELFAYFENSATIPLDKVHSFYDSILFRLSWIYDLNFEFTLGEFKKRKFGQQLLNKIPTSNALREIEKLTHTFILK